MNAKAVVPLILAVVLGLVAALLVKNAISRKSSPSNQGNLVTVVVAKQNIDPGGQLTKEDLVVSKVPADAAPGQVFSDPNQLVGRVATTPLLKGQTILETFLAPTGTAASGIPGGTGASTGKPFLGEGILAGLLLLLGAAGLSYARRRRTSA